MFRSRPRPETLLALPAATLLLAGCSCSHAAVPPDATRPPAEDATASADAGSEPTAPRGRPERCNGVDDDRDGKVDEGCPIRLTPGDGADHGAVALDGDRVLWLRRFGDPGDRAERTEVHLLSLSDGRARLVDVTTSESLSHVSLWGGYAAALQDYATCRLIDLDTGEAVIVPFGVVSHQRCSVRAGYALTSAHPPSCGVWCDDYEVYVYDIAAAEVRVIGRHPGEQQYPTTDGEVVVWRDDRLHGDHLIHDIFAAGIGGGEPWPVTRLEEGVKGLDGPPPLHDGRVLVGEASCAIATYDVYTAERRELSRTEADCDARVHDMSDRFAVVERFEGSESDLWLIDRTTLEVHRLTNYNRTSTSARIDGDHIIWLDDRDDSWEVYYTDLSDFDDGDFFPEGRSPEWSGP